MQNVNGLTCCVQKEAVMEVLQLQTYKDCAMMNVTKQVRDAVQQSGVQEGIVVVHCPHTTAGMTINENADPDVVRDLLEALEKMVPNMHYRHMEGNSPAHLRASLMGNSVTVPITHGEMALGTWQGIYFCEFDGPRNRRFFVQIIEA